MKDTRPKFQEILDTLCNFEIFGLKKRFFLSNTPRHRRYALSWLGILKNGLHFWIFHRKIWIPSHGQEILTGFELPKRSKTPQKRPFFPFLDTQEAVLGELNFGRENEDQIQKFHLFWKVDR